MTRRYTGGRDEAAGFNLPSNGAYTIQCWIHVDTLPATNAGLITLTTSDYWTSSQTTELAIQSTGYLFFRNRFWSSSPEFYRETSYTTPSSIALNDWIHVAYTYDGTNALAYVNGVLVNSSTLDTNTGAVRPNFAYCALGSSGYTGEAQALGVTLQSAMVFASALSASQIKESMSTLEPPPGVAPYAWWRLDNGGVWSSDQSGNGHTLSTVGTAVGAGTGQLSTAIGGSIVSGDATVIAGTSTAASGGAIAGGSATNSAGITTSASGGAVTGGSAVNRYGVSTYAIGGSVAGGVVANAIGASTSATAGAVAGGEANNAIGIATSALGGAISGGEALVFGRVFSETSKRGISRLTSWYRKPNNSALLASWLEEFHLIRVVALQLLESTLDNAEGVHLDVFGKYVGLERGWFSDDDFYRELLYIKALINRCKGTRPEIVEIAKRLVNLTVSPPVNTVDLVDYYPAGWVAYSNNAIDPDYGNIVARLLSLTRAGGVWMNFVWASSRPEHHYTPFKFAPSTSVISNSPNGFDAGGLSAVSDGTTVVSWEPPPLYWGPDPLYWGDDPLVW